jgi:spermidine/putrescine transport system permease protein
MAGDRHLSPRARRTLLIGPAVVIIAALMILPLCLMAYVSTLERGQYGGVNWGDHTTQAYVSILFAEALDGSFGFNSAYIEIFLRSFWLSLSTTVIALAIGFPTALYMALQPERYRNLLIFLVTIPSGPTCWCATTLGSCCCATGLINEGLISLGRDRQARSLCSTPTDSIAIGLTYSFLPFMVLPIYASLEKIDFRLVEAAYDLYADRRTYSGAY